MLTGRGGALLLVALLLAGFGLAMGIAPLALVGMSLLLWFFLAWIVFLVRLRVVVPRLRVARLLADEHGAVESLWARIPYRVVLEIRNDTRLSLPFVVAIDRLPLLASWADETPAEETDEWEAEGPSLPAAATGAQHASGALGGGEALRLEYTFEAVAAGTLRFEGVKLLVSDLQGFFATPFFLRRPASYRCLPALANARGQIPAVKRLNILPLLGHHPHRRPGTGIELLELRDYLPGDPPKLIAWKISAKRDRLMTRELESEVPIRCTLFVDTSDAVRIGVTGRNALARLTEIASAVAQANGAARDLTGLCLFDDRGVRHMVRPERGRRHLLKLVHLLADHADLLPESTEVTLARLLPLAYGLAQDLYPEEVRPPLNVFPWWLPALSPRPAYTTPRPPAPPSRLARLMIWLDRRIGDTPVGWLLSLPRRFSVSEYRAYRQRKQLAALVAARHGLGPGGMARLLEDDLACRDALLTFLAEHQVPAPLRFFDAEGRYAFASPAKVQVLARALLGAIQRGRDNELFVLLVDLLENPALGPLLKAIQVARAKHHQVLLICPWPDGVPLPRTGRGDNRASGPSLQGLLESGAKTDDLLQLTTVWRLHQAYRHMARALGRAGVKVLCARQKDAVPLVLERMHRLRVLARGVS